MDRSFIAPVTYFLQEGKENLEECLKTAFQAAKEQAINKIVIFTAFGDGVKLALEKFCSQPDFSEIKLVAVTFPSGKRFTGPDGQPINVQITAENAAFFAERGVPVVKAHLPFDPIRSPLHSRVMLGQDLSLIGDALSMFGGSMSLCVQAIALACDAGAIEVGEHVIAATADTAILAQATSTRRMLSELIIREILCKPAILTVGRKEVAGKVLEKEPLELPPAEEEHKDKEKEQGPKE